MKKLFSPFFTEEGGASLAEYALLVSLIAVVVIVGLQLFGFSVFNSLVGSTDSVSAAIDFATGGGE